MRYKLRIRTRPFNHDNNYQIVEKLRDDVARQYLEMKIEEYIEQMMEWTTAPYVVVSIEEDK